MGNGSLAVGEIPFKETVVLDRAELGPVKNKKMQTDGNRFRVSEGMGPESQRTKVHEDT
ncbi:hypothetical protein TWF106_000334 [Orbilia oligospora]|uniref:Uncharacterized protein n=1 Tax=Orbilia oligospora TaxID=2813651 RepID=A0A7C8US60_ORBOL|nr:hypothetical protein TWF106_000334 [Orbilia oligospora]